MSLHIRLSCCFISTRQTGVTMSPTSAIPRAALTWNLIEQSSQACASAVSYPVQSSPVEPPTSGASAMLLNQHSRPLPFSKCSYDSNQQLCPSKDAACKAGITFSVVLLLRPTFFVLHLTRQHSLGTNLRTGRAVAKCHHSSITNRLNK